ncbi:MAG: glycosyltransferase family 2 protein [Bilifractor sp.]|jgi:rhamnosyltransferase
MDQKTVDIMIPTHKPDRNLFTLLKRLGKQDYPIKRIYITNTDETFWDPSLEEEFPDVIVNQIDADAFDHGGTRHEMALQSEADLMLFMTQDALPADRHLVGNLVRMFSDETERIAVAYGRQTAGKDAGTLDRFSRAFNYPRESVIHTQEDVGRLGIKAYFCSDVCAMYDREIYFSLGGFPRPSIFNEDMIFAGMALQAGYAAAYAADAVVFHSHNYSGSQQFHRYFDNGVSQAQHPEIFEAVPPEGEGKRLVKDSAAYVIRKNRAYLLFPLVWQSACKYTGFWLGKHYRKLPEKFVKACSQNRTFWKQKKGPGPGDSGFSEEEKGTSP